MLVSWQACEVRRASLITNLNPKEEVRVIPLLTSRITPRGKKVATPINSWQLQIFLSSSRRSRTLYLLTFSAFLILSSLNLSKMKLFLYYKRSIFNLGIRSTSKISNYWKVITLFVPTHKFANWDPSCDIIYNMYYIFQIKKRNNGSVTNKAS